jgi:hypothetical protein
MINSGKDSGDGVLLSEVPIHLKKAQVRRAKPRLSGSAVTLCTCRFTVFLPCALQQEHFGPPYGKSLVV